MRGAGRGSSVSKLVKCKGSCCPNWDHCGALLRAQRGVLAPTKGGLVWIDDPAPSEEMSIEALCES